MQPILREVPERLESTRLTLRSPRPGDGPMIFEAVRDSIDELRRYPAYLPWVVAEPSVEAAETFCREGCANFIARRDFPYLVLLRDSGAMVGASGLHHVDWRVPKFEIGFWGRTAYRRAGLLTEAVRALLDLAFEKLGARRVEVLTDDANDRACALCERLGLVLEGTLRYERVAPDGSLCSTRVYALTR